MTGPLDYSLCDQTVTVYHKQGNRVLRQVIEGCYYHWREEQTEDAYGICRQTLCQLILPGAAHSISIGDRVYNGIGPQIGIGEWATFLPVTVTGLSEINYVSPCYWEGTVCHTEAGRK